MEGCVWAAWFLGWAGQARNNDQDEIKIQQAWLPRPSDARLERENACENVCLEVGCWAEGPGRSPGQRSLDSGTEPTATDGLPLSAAQFGSRSSADGKEPSDRGPIGHLPLLDALIQWDTPALARYFACVPFRGPQCQPTRVAVLKPPTRPPLITGCRPNVHHRDLTYPPPADLRSSHDAIDTAPREQPQQGGQSSSTEGSPPPCQGCI